MVGRLLDTFERSNSVFDDFNDIVRKFDELTGSFFNTKISGHLENVHFSSPKMNVYKKKMDDGRVKYKLEFLVPDYTKEDLKIKLVDDNTLIVEGKKEKQERDEDFDNCEIKEFVLKNSFKRKVIIPNIQKDSIKSKLKNGVLIIELVSGKRKEIEEIEID